MLTLAAAAAIALIDVRLEAPNMTPLVATLAVAAEEEASYNSAIEGAESATCAVENGQPITRAIGITLHRSDSTDALFRVGVTWRRQVGPCSQTSVRNVSLNQTLALDLDATETLRLEGGLVVRLHRKR